MRIILTFICLIFSTVIAASAETRVAFLVANSDYEAAPALKNPAADVALIAETLGGLEFEVAVHHDLARGEIASELSAFLDANSDADVTLFYFAGHGMQFENRNYLLGTDARLQTSFDVEAHGLDLSRVIDLLARKSKAALVFIDACRDNPLATEFYSQNFSETRAGMSRGLTRLPDAFNGTMITFSASPGEVANDGDGATSPFAAALARHLPSENMEVLSLMKRVTRDVRSATGNTQTPMVTNDLVQEIFLKRGDGAEAAAIAYREEERLFEAAKAIDTPRAWNVFFERFPDGRFLQEALVARESATAIELASVSGIENARNVVANATGAGQRIKVNQDAYEAAENGLEIDSESVRRIQEALSARGYDAGPVDGVLGAGTRRAIADFQAFVGLPSTGAITAGTAAKLGVRLDVVEGDDETFFASRNARRYDPLQLALFEDDERLLRAVEALRQYEIVYGYFQDRLYIGALIWQHQSFEQAQLLAARAGGYLATLTSAAENDFAFRLVRDDRRFWQDCSVCPDVFGPSFGLHQLDGSFEPAGGFVWITGEPVEFTAWSPGEPGNHNGNEDFASFLYGEWANRDRAPDYKDNRWGDLPDSSKSIIIEIE